MVLKVKSLVLCSVFVRNKVLFCQILIVLKFKTHFTICRSLEGFDFINKSEEEIVESEKSDQEESEMDEEDDGDEMEEEESEQEEFEVNWFYFFMCTAGMKVSRPKF